MNSASLMLAHFVTKFDKHDKEGDGKMNKKEFRNLLKEVVTFPESAYDDVFDMFDGIGNKDGKLTKAEMLAGVKKIFGFASETIEKSFDEHAGSDGKMDMVEFKAFLKSHGIVVAPEEMDSYFTNLDLSGDGNIGKTEAMRLFGC